MYSWIDAKWNPTGGRCPHGCSYCYVPEMPYTQEKYGGEPRLIEKELETDLYKCKGKTPPMTVFVCNMSDLFAEAIPNDWIYQILAHCNKYPDNTYLFQTKNPHRFKYWLGLGSTGAFPPNLCALEFIECHHPKAHFHAVDDGEHVEVIK